MGTCGKKVKVPGCENIYRYIFQLFEEQLGKFPKPLPALKKLPTSFDSNSTLTPPMRWVNCFKN